MPRQEWTQNLRAEIAAGDAVIRAAAADPPSRLVSLAGARSKDDASSDDPPPARRFAKEQLKALVERIERLQEEKKAISDDIADVYREAVANGYDRKALHTVVRLRGQDVNERKEQEAILETYLHALGMLLE